MFLVFRLQSGQVLQSVLLCLTDSDQSGVQRVQQSGKHLHRLPAAAAAGSQAFSRPPVRPTLSSSVGGVHGVDVAVQLVPERQPGLCGEVDLRSVTEASCAVAVAAPGSGGGQAGFCLLSGN